MVSDEAIEDFKILTRKRVSNPLTVPKLLGGASGRVGTRHRAREGVKKILGDIFL